jgi:hypothetical protein
MGRGVVVLGLGDAWSLPPGMGPLLITKSQADGFWHEMPMRDQRKDGRDTFLSETSAAATAVLVAAAAAVAPSATANFPPYPFPSPKRLKMIPFAPFLIDLSFSWAYGKGWP